MELMHICIGAFLLCSSVISGYSKDNSRKSIISKFPFQVSVEVDGKPKCGGAILGDHWVLSGYSCIPDNETEVKRVKIRAGSAHVGTGGVLHNVVKIVHSEDTTFSVIKIGVPFVYSSKIHWSRPSIEYLSTSDKILIAGWGIEGKHTQHSLLKTANVKKISRDECEKKFLGKTELQDSLACVVPVSSGDNACIADVGTPVTVHGLVAAVVYDNGYCFNSSLPLLVSDIGDASFFLTDTLSEPVTRS